MSKARRCTGCGVVIVSPTGNIRVCEACFMKLMSRDKRITEAEELEDLRASLVGRTISDVIMEGGTPIGLRLDDGTEVYAQEFWLEVRER